MLYPTGEKKLTKILFIFRIGISTCHGPPTHKHCFPIYSSRKSELNQNVQQLQTKLCQTLFLFSKMMKQCRNIGSTYVNDEIGVWSEMIIILTFD